MYSLDDVGLLCTLGGGKEAVASALLHPGAPIPAPGDLLTRHNGRSVGRINAGLPELEPHLARFDCRNNRLAEAALNQIMPAIHRATKRYGAERIGVVMATSTSGIAASEKAVKSLQDTGRYPVNYHAIQGALGGLGAFVATRLELRGPAYTLSTACSSSANAALSARRLIRSGLCDAVLFGGVDSLCELTLEGFAALEAESADLCRPFSTHRDGINIGEAAAIFLMTKDGDGPRLAGGAGSSDAHHISAPHPEGDGAYRAMCDALADAGLVADDIGYLNLHGTGTRQNDAMEAKAVHRLFPTGVPCGSTKSMTGHTLGAAGALELAICWLLLTRRQPGRLPPALYHDSYDPALPALQLADGTGACKERPLYCLSNSFAFGGSNVALILGASTSA